MFRYFDAIALIGQGQVSPISVQETGRVSVIPVRVVNLPGPCRGPARVARLNCARSTALRERRGDIPALARHFAARAGERLHGRALTPTDEDLLRLQRYPWPGNVRELAAVLERAAILGNGRTLDVSTALGGEVDLAPAPAGDERTQITDALERCQGRIEGPFGAARALGVNPHTLRSRMRRLGIDWSAFRRAEG